MDKASNQREDNFSYYKNIQQKSKTKLRKSTQMRNIHNQDEHLTLTCQGHAAVTYIHTCTVVPVWVISKQNFWYAVDKSRRPLCQCPYGKGHRLETKGAQHESLAVGGNSKTIIIIRKMVTEREQNSHNWPQVMRWKRTISHDNNKHDFTATSNNFCRDNQI